MKRTLLSIIGCLLLVGCDIHNPYKQSVTMFADDTNFTKQFTYTITIIDRCEYLTYRAAEGYVTLTHKGNCTNCQAIFRAWYAENK